MVKEFEQYIVNMGIIVKNILVKAHHFISMIEYYYGLLSQVYSIIITEIPDLQSDLILYIAC